MLTNTAFYLHEISYLWVILKAQIILRKSLNLTSRSGIKTIICHQIVRFVCSGLNLYSGRWSILHEMVLICLIPDTIIFRKMQLIFYRSSVLRLKFKELYDKSPNFTQVWVEHYMVERVSTHTHTHTLTHTRHTHTYIHIFIQKHIYISNGTHFHMYMVSL